jgi:endo-1,4-beta-D-glucanase Y
VVCPPAAAAAGKPRRPFPQHVGYPGCPDCIHPAVAQATMDMDVQKFYGTWKGSMLKKFAAGQVMGEQYISAGANGDITGWPASVTSITQSEGHGYGMLVFALMAGFDPNAKAIYDSLDKVRKAFPSSSDKRLMSWALPQTGDVSLQAQPPATDGDLDMAYSLLLAYDQWGDEGTNHYLEEAKTIIAGMKEKFVTAGMGQYFPRLNIGDPDHLGSVAPESKPFLTRPSDYMVDHMLAFKAATGDPVWGDVATGMVNILQKVRNATTGLVPDFVVADPPVASTTGTGDEGLCYQCFDYNSCRVPWRQAVAVAHFGVAGSRDVDDKMASWASGKFKDNPATMTAVFNLDGTGRETFSDAAFTSPMVAAGITAASHQSWLDKGWAAMKGADAADYYGGSITLLSMLLVSGNWWPPGGGPAAGCTP